MSNKILAILHRSCGDTGSIGKKLKERGYELDIRCIIEGDLLPDPKLYKAIIVFGGVMSANDCQEIEGIRQELNWIPEVLKSGTPYLGICLGAQLLARALGAGVSRKQDESVEIGFHNIIPTTDNSGFLPKNGIRFYQWHLEEFSIPDSCERLAKSELFQNQAFKFNDKVIGLQFHPEATREMIDCWVQREPNNLLLSGAQSYKTQVELFRECSATVNDWLDNLLDNLLS